MALTFRDVKLANLTSAEQDANIRTLRDMILDVQANPTPGVGIVNVTQDVGSSIVTFHLSNGSTEAITIPPSNLRYRGDWTAATAYLAGDWVRVLNLGLYLVRIAHTSDATFDPEVLSGGLPVYQLAVPFLTQVEAWETNIVVANQVTFDLSVSDKHILLVTANVEIQAPVNAFPGQPFVVRVQMVGGTFAVTFSAAYLGAAPEVLIADGDETVLSAIVLDVVDDTTETAETLVINTVKTIPA